MSAMLSVHHLYAAIRSRPKCSLPKYKSNCQYWHRQIYSIQSISRSVCMMSSRLCGILSLYDRRPPAVQWYRDCDRSRVSCDSIWARHSVRFLPNRAQERRQHVWYCVLSVAIFCVKRQTMRTHYTKKNRKFDC